MNHAIDVAAPAPSVGLVAWFFEGSRAARRSLWAAAFGWMLDAFDVMLFSLVLSAVMGEFGLSRTSAGLLGAITLTASGIGGVAFGWLADRYGRRRALMWSILVYSIFTGACGLAQTATQLGMCRFLVGLGMGGEWACGAALVSETWPDRHRGKAISFVHSFWAVGYAAAAILVAFVLPRFGWRTVFFAGVAPALLVLWIRSGIEESHVWLTAQAAAKSAKTATTGLADIFRGRFGPITVMLTLLSLFTLFAYWGMNFWVPAYLSLPVAQGGLGLSTSVTTQLVLAMQVGVWIGLVSFGFVCDALGRRRSYVLYLVLGAVLVVLYSRTHNPFSLMLLGPLVALFGTGQLAGFGAVTAEIYPTSVRAAAQGFTFNVGRLGSAFAPLLMGTLAQARGFETAFAVTGGALLLGAVCWVWLPETRGKSLPA